jgi:hypothetical protein
MSVIYDLLSPFGNATVSRRSLVVDGGGGFPGLYHLASSLLVKGGSINPHPPFKPHPFARCSLSRVLRLQKLCMQH